MSSSHQAVIDAFYALCSAHSSPESIAYFRGVNGAEGSRVEMVLPQKVGDKRVRVTFTGVQSLCLGRIEPFCGMVIAIQCIRDWGWERLNYEVRDAEHGGEMKFYCEAMGLRVEERM